MDPFSVTFAVVPVAIELYKIVMGAYDLFLEVKEFPKAYRQLRLELLIERHRLTLWSNHVIMEKLQDGKLQSSEEVGCWRIFEMIFREMLDAFDHSFGIMEGYQKAEVLSAAPGPLDPNMLKAASVHESLAPKPASYSMRAALKFVLREKQKLRDLAKNLKDWNNSLDQMTTRLEQESRRRKLRSKLSSIPSEDLQLLEEAGHELGHEDIRQMCSTRRTLEESFDIERDRQITTVTSTKYALEYKWFRWDGVPFQTDQARATAVLREERVVVDWRGAADESWRRENPEAFKQRTNDLAKILNQDLRPLGLALLHCVGYLCTNPAVTGYAFSMPSYAQPGQKPVTLYKILENASGADIPALGERFDIAKAIAKTVFEIHNMGWLHKNVSSRNILFWPQRSRANPDEFVLGKPYLVGFDISRPNFPGEMTEKPVADRIDDVYRHPRYKGSSPESFIPAFDIFSLGVVLFELGLWRLAAPKPKTPSHGPKPPLDHKPVSVGAEDFIEKTILSKPVHLLKSFTGTRYQNIVTDCLKRAFDEAYDKSLATGNFSDYQNEVQSRVVDPIMLCNA